MCVCDGDTCAFRVGRYNRYALCPARVITTFGGKTAMSHPAVARCRLDKPRYRASSVPAFHPPPPPHALAEAAAAAAAIVSLVHWRTRPSRWDGASSV